MKENRIGQINIKFGWTFLFIGIFFAMFMGIFAFKEGWLGGYISLTRRLLRLAHISIMALSIINILYGLFIDRISLSDKLKRFGSLCGIVAAIFMPTICLLTIFHRFFENLFFIPAISFTCAILIMVLGLFYKKKV